MKKYIFSVLMATITMLGNSEVLPKPNIQGGKPLMESIAQRQSHRDMTADGKVSKQQELSVYVVTPEGVSLYDAAANTLEKVSDADLRQLVGMQQFAIDCPLNILFVVDTTLQPDASMLGYTAGAASQNVYLYCASEGLKTVLRASFAREELQKALNLPANKRVLFIQTVGK